MKFEAGDLVIIPFPFSDLSSSKARPAMVLSSATYNESNLDLLVCAVTAKTSNEPHNVPIDGRNLVQGSLPKASWVRADKVATLEKRLAHKIIGRVSQTIVRKVIKQLLLVLGPATKSKS